MPSISCHQRLPPPPITLTPATNQERSKWSGGDWFEQQEVPWLSPAIVNGRRTNYGFSAPEVADFIRGAEFISLGCFCGVTKALQCLGLRKHSYPFDWVRSDVSGIIQCLNSGFHNFLDYTMTGESPADKSTFYGGAWWGGSFWHHNPEDPKQKEMFRRRIRRLWGFEEVPTHISRVFCVALNSTDNLAMVRKLYTSLQDVLPDADIYLLVFMDNQKAAGTFRVKRLDGMNGDNILFYCTDEELFANNGRSWTHQGHAEAYGNGIAAAIRAWAEEDTDDIPVVSSVSDLYDLCEKYDGGSPACQLYWPTRIETNERLEVGWLPACAPEGHSCAPEGHSCAPEGHSCAPEVGCAQGGCARSSPSLWSKLLCGSSAASNPSNYEVLNLFEWNPSTDEHIRDGGVSYDANEDSDIIFGSMLP
jgi:hypothetical protein